MNFKSTVTSGISLLMIFIMSSKIISQDFTRITEGEIVNNDGESFGAAWIDYNNDGFLDLYVSNGGAAAVNQPNFLYKNNGDGSFTKITSGDIVTDEFRSIGSSWADVDNDGDIDAFVANRDGQNNSFYLNNGNETFTKVTSGNFVTDGGNTNSGSIVDFNRDGRVDLFGANFMGQRFLYKNEGNLSFSRITSGTIALNASNSISASWGDFNNDGYPDLYVANAGVPGPSNDFYVNNGDETFSRITLGDIVTDGAASMGSAWGDYDNDEDLDLFVANQSNQNNSFYINHVWTFTKDTGSIIANDGGQSISPSWVDVDNDGDLDLHVTNWTAQDDFLYLNSGAPDYNFTKVTSGDIVDDSRSTMGAAWGDYDNDGDMDLFLAVRDNADNILFRNETSGNNWITINCVGSQSNRSAIGVRVKIYATINGHSYWQMREINSQSGYNSQHSLTAHFGLGDAEIIDSLVIIWPSRNNDLFLGIGTNIAYRVVESGGITLVENQSLPEYFTLYQNFPNPFNPATNLSFVIGEPSFVNLVVYDILGNEIATLINEEKSEGTYEVEFNASRLNSGIYFYKLTAGSFSKTMKMSLLK